MFKAAESTPWSAAIRERFRRAYDRMRVEAVGRPLSIVVEGAGDWVTEAYRPAFIAIADRHALRVTYANDTTYGAAPPWLKALLRWETYLDKASPVDFALYKDLNPDAVFVVTPDFTHVDLVSRWLNHTSVVFVEKPFDIDPGKVAALLKTLHETTTEVFGLDHYLCYILPLVENGIGLDSFLGTAIESIDFVLTESNLISLRSEVTFLSGMTCALLPHGLALASLFGKLDGIANINVLSSGRYHPWVCSSDGGPVPMLRFQAETSSHVEFVLPHASDNNRLIRVRSLVGKGFNNTVKYFEARTASGRFMRADFSTAEADAYPSGRIFFGTATTDGEAVTDRYMPSRHLTITQSPPPVAVPRSRYAALVAALASGSPGAALPLLLTVDEALPLVTALAAIVNAIREHDAERYELGQIHVWQDVEDS